MSRQVLPISHDAPTPVGPYSQAVIAGGLVFTAGQIAIDHESGHLVGNDMATQATKVMNNIEAILQHAGTSMANCVKLTVYLEDIGQTHVVNEIMAKWFDEGNEPARALVGVSACPGGALIEIDCVAALA